MYPGWKGEGGEILIFNFYFKLTLEVVKKSVGTQIMTSGFMFFLTLHILFFSTTIWKKFKCFLALICRMLENTNSIILIHEVRKLRH